MSNNLGARMHCLLVVFFSLALLVWPSFGLAKTPQQAVPITAEPEHKIRFDNGKVRMYEVRLAKGQATLMHEHRADSFSVIFRDTEVIVASLGGATTKSAFSAGRVGFTSTARGPYSHRVVASQDTDFHVIAMELIAPEAASTIRADALIESGWPLANRLVPFGDRARTCCSQYQVAALPRRWMELAPGCGISRPAISDGQTQPRH
jgi:hypothetical protein